MWLSSSFGSGGQNIAKEPNNLDHGSLADGGSKAQCDPMYQRGQIVLWVGVWVSSSHMRSG